MAQLKTFLDAGLASVGSCSSGNVPPAPVASNPVPYQCWVDTSISPHPLKYWDGSQWVTAAYIDPTAHAFSFTQSAVPNVISAGSYSILDSDRGKDIIFTASSTAVSLAAPGAEEVANV